MSESEYRRIYCKCYGGASFTPTATLLANREFVHAMNAAHIHPSRDVSPHKCRREIFKTRINGERVTVEWRR